MMNGIFEFFNYEFLVRALIAGVLIALSAGLIGVPLVLRRNAMIGDGLSHVGFSAFVVATVLGLAPVQFAIPAVILASFLIIKLNNGQKINGEAAIALVSSSALAIGVFLISIFGVNVDINSYLFGSILSVNTGDVWLSLAVAVMILLFYIIFYNRIFSVTFDREFAEAIGIKVGIYDAIFAALCSVVIVIGMKLAGALLVSSLIIFPTLISRYLASSFLKTSILAGAVAVVGFVIGLISSYVFSTPTGATIVLVNLLLLILSKIMYNIIHERV